MSRQGLFGRAGLIGIEQRVGPLEISGLQGVGHRDRRRSGVAQHQERLRRRANPRWIERCTSQLSVHKQPEEMLTLPPL